MTTLQSPATLPKRSKSYEKSKCPPTGAEKGVALSFLSASQSLISDAFSG